MAGTACHAVVEQHTGSMARRACHAIWLDASVCIPHNGGRPAHLVAGDEQTAERRPLCRGQLVRYGSRLGMGEAQHKVPRVLVPYRLLVDVRLCHLVAEAVLRCQFIHDAWEWRHWQAVQGVQQPCRRPRRRECRARHRQRALDALCAALVSTHLSGCWNRCPG